MIQQIRTYSELVKIPTFIDRYRYLKLGGQVGDETFGWERYINQNFYHSQEWRNFRRQIILRDNGCDLAMPGYEFGPDEYVYIHHLNPITTFDIVNQSEYLMNPEYVISCRYKTHQAIHFGDESMIMEYEPVVRKPNDMCPWKE